MMQHSPETFIANVVKSSAGSDSTWLDSWNFQAGLMGQAIATAKNELFYVLKSKQRTNLGRVGINEAG